MCQLASLLKILSWVLPGSRALQLTERRLPESLEFLAELGIARDFFEVGDFPSMKRRTKGLLEHLLKKGYYVPRVERAHELSQEHRGSCSGPFIQVLGPKTVYCWPNFPTELDENTYNNESPSRTDILLHEGIRSQQPLLILNGSLGCSQEEMVDILKAYQFLKQLNSTLYFRHSICHPSEWLNDLSESIPIIGKPDYYSLKETPGVEGLCMPVGRLCYRTMKRIQLSHLVWLSRIVGAREFIEEWKSIVWNLPEQVSALVKAEKFVIPGYLRQALDVLGEDLETREERCALGPFLFNLSASGSPLDLLTNLKELLLVEELLEHHDLADYTEYLLTGHEPMLLSTLFDWRPENGFPRHLYDITEDDRASSWGRVLKSQPLSSGVYPVKVTLIQILYLADLTKLKSLKIIKYLLEITPQPFRLFVVPTFNSRDLSENVPRMISNYYFHLLAESDQKARQFLLKLIGLKQNVVYYHLQKIVFQEDPTFDLLNSQPATKQVLDFQAFRGLPKECLVVNGQLLLNVTKGVINDALRMTHLDKARSIKEIEENGVFGETSPTILGSQGFLPFYHPLITPQLLDGRKPVEEFLKLPLSLLHLESLKVWSHPTGTGFPVLHQVFFGSISGAIMVLKAYADHMRDPQWNRVVGSVLKVSSCQPMVKFIPIYEDVNEPLRAIRGCLDCMMTSKDAHLKLSLFQQSLFEDMDEKSVIDTCQEIVGFKCRTVLLTHLSSAEIRLIQTARASGPNPVVLLNSRRLELYVSIESHHLAFLELLEVERALSFSGVGHVGYALGSHIDPIVQVFLSGYRAYIHQKLKPDSSASSALDFHEFIRLYPAVLKKQAGQSDAFLKFSGILDPFSPTSFRLLEFVELLYELEIPVQIIFHPLRVNENAQQFAAFWNPNILPINPWELSSKLFKYYVNLPVPRTVVKS